MITLMAETIANRMDSAMPTIRNGYSCWSSNACFAILDSYNWSVLNHDGFIINKTPVKPPAIVKISGTLIFSLMRKYASSGVKNTRSRESDTD